jgi:hypothetical protein
MKYLEDFSGFTQSLQLEFFGFVGWGETWVHLVRRPLTGLLYQPRMMMMMMMMSVEQSVEWELAGETQVLGKNLPQRHFVHNKSHMTWPGLEPVPPLWEAGD